MPLAPTYPNSQGSGETGFDSGYGDTPIANLDQNQRQWYHPIVDRMFRTKSVWTGLVRFYQNLGAVNAKTMTITEISDVHPNFDPLGMREIWMPAAHLDSRSLDLTFTRFGGKVAYHEYDDIINYWKVNGAGSGWDAVLRSSLGQHIIDVHDLLIRNAFLSVPFQIFMTGSTYGSLTGSSIFDYRIADEIWLGMQYRGDVPLAQDPNMPQANSGTLLCLTTPGVIYDIQQQIDDAAVSSVKFVNAMQYADPKRLLNYEVGMLRNVRYMAHPRNTLWNCGAVEHQTYADAAITAGDGAPDPASERVDSVYAVGQKGVTHSISVASASGFEVGDIVTIGCLRTSDFGVSNGVDWRDGKMTVRRIVKIAGNNISFDLPILVDFTEALDTGKYAWVTKGRHVHPSVFIGGPDAVVGGVGRPISLHNPAPVDDFGQVFRFSWDAYEGFNLYKPSVAEVVFSAGSTRVTGRVGVS